MLKSFDCLVNEKTRILIVGTMPGTASLQAGEYYAHPRNAFWQIIADIFNQGKPFESYESKKECLLDNAVGLWDNLHFCERRGSLDSNIRHERPNDFETLLSANPQIKVLLFNGQKSFAYFQKYHAPLLEKVCCRPMPSTSPANARMPYAEKCRIWRKELLS